MNESNTKSFTVAVRLAAIAVLSAAALVIASLVVPENVHSYMSSLPLALAGAAYAVLQTRLEMSRSTLLKRLVLAAAFVGWAADQLLPPGPVAVLLGDAVIFGFVVDVGWLIRDQVAAKDVPPG